MGYFNIGDETLLSEKWCSILFHIQNKRKWSSYSKLHKCVHPRITKSKARKRLWLIPTSDAFKALQSIVLDKHVLGDLRCLTKFSQTRILEIFHALYNKWIPKSQHFSHLGMVTRSQSAAIDFNSGSNLPQAKTKGGQGKYDLGYSKITKQVKKDKTHYFEIIDRTVEVTKNKMQLPLPKLPENPPKNTAPTERLNKKTVVETQKSRFSK